MSDSTDNSEELQRGQRAIEVARASTFLEGLVPDEHTMTLLKRHVEGKITIEQVIEGIRCPHIKV